MEAVTRSGWRSKALWSLGALVLLSIIPLGIWVYVSRGNRELAEAIAEADRADPGWRLEELQSHRANVPDSANAALVVEKVISLLPPGWPSAALLNDPEERKRATGDFSTPFDLAMQDIQSSKHNNEPLSDLHRRHLAPQLGQARQALDEARKLAGMPFGRFDGRAVPAGWDVAGAELQMRSNVGQLLGYDVINQADRGQIDEALVCVAAVLNAWRSGGDEPQILVASAGQSGVRPARDLQFALAHGVASNESLAKLQSLLEEQDRVPVLLNLVRVERAELHNRMSRVESGELDIGWTGMPNSSWASPLRPIIVPSAHAWALRFFAKCAEIAKLPSPDRKPRWDALMATIDAAPIPARMAVESTLVRNPFERTQENQTVLRCMIIALATERFRLQRGRWPASVGDLMELMNAELTLDPVTGKPLEIRKSEEGLLICGHYSQSKDLKLPLDAREGVRFRLWDVSRRGQKNLASSSGSTH